MGIAQSAVARQLGVTSQFRDLRGGAARLLPQQIAIVGQGATASSYATTKQQITSAGQAGTLYGFGSPIHLAALKLLPSNGDGVGTIPVTVYPLEDDGSGVAAAGDITPSGTATESGEYRVKINEILSEAFVIPAGAITVATVVTAMFDAIQATPNMPMIATDSTTVLDLAAKWAGASSNDCHIEIVGPSVGVTFTITQPTGGAVNPDVDPALALIGDRWETLVLNLMEIADTTTLDKYSVWGEGRWGVTVRRPAVVFTGNTETTVTAATAVSDARPTDRVNSQLVAPGSNELPFVVAARQLARIAKVANDNPPVGYAKQRATTLAPGNDSDQWTFPDRDSAIKKGSSTIEVIDSVINISQVVTFYKPTGEEPPAYRFVRDIVKLQQIVYNLNLIFEAQEWAAAPLIPDGQPTVNEAARSPSDAKAAVNSLIDSLASLAILSDPATAKTQTTAVISSQNPNRLDVGMTVQIVGNSDIIDVTMNWGFFFGSQQAA